MPHFISNGSYDCSWFQRIHSETVFSGDSGGPLFRFEPTTKQFTAIGLTVGAVAEYASKVR